MNKNLVYGGILIAILLAVGGYFFPKALPQTAQRLGTILDTFTGDYFNAVTSNGGGAFQINGTSVLTTSTTTGGTAGTAYYYSNGNIQYAYVEPSFAATSSILVRVPNPFGTATSTLLLNQSSCRTTTGTTGASTYTASLSTTTAGTYGSSTPSLVLDMSITSGPNYIPFTGNTATSVAAVAGSGVNILPGMTPGGLSNYIIGPSIDTVLRNATATPGVFSSYASGSCDLVYKKI